MADAELDKAIQAGWHQARATEIGSAISVPPATTRRITEIGRPISVAHTGHRLRLLHEV